MQHKLLLTTTLLIALGGAACGNDNGGDVIDGGVNVPPDGGPDGGCAVEPNFTSLHEKVFGGVTCARGGCHDMRTNSGMLDLSGGKDSAYNALVNAATAEPGTGFPTRIVPNNAAMSSAYLKVSELDPPGTGAAMPLGCSIDFPSACLPECQVTAIETWINAGAMND